MDRRLGRPLPHQLPNPTRADPSPINLSHPVSPRNGVSGITPGFPGLFRRKGHVPTRYSPVRRSRPKARARLACVKPAASVRSEPGSNSQVETRRSGFLTSEPLHIPRPHQDRSKRHRLPCIRPPRGDRKPTNGEADTPIIGFPLRSRHADSRPSKRTKPPTYPFIIQNMSKSARQRSAAASLL